jgi:hypothetical protein
MKIVKRILLGLLILLLLIIGTLITVPYFFKDEILSEAKRIANESLNAKVEFQDIDLSLFSNFPALSVEINQVTISGKNQFEKDTLFAIDAMVLAVDLGELMSKNIIIEKILLDHPTINLKKISDKEFNWDVAKKSKTTVATDSATTVEPKKETVEKKQETQQEQEEKSDLPAVQLKEFKIIDANLVYDDQVAGMLAKIKNFNLGISGDFADNVTDVAIKIAIENILFKQGGVQLVNNLQFNVDTEVKADLKNQVFTLSNNEIALNSFILNLNGVVKPQKNGAIETDVVFKANQTDFKTLLDFVPENVKASIKDVKTKGELGLDIAVKGTYFKEETPELNLNFFIKNASVQYPALPKAVENINMNLNVKKPQGSLDLLVVNLSNFSTEIANNPIKLKFYLDKPISNPNFKGMLDCDVVLESLKDAIPMEDLDLKGKFNADMNFAGNKALVDAQKYDQINMEGDFVLSNIEIKTKALPEALKISSAKLKVTPKLINLANFDGTVGKNDFGLNGKISNFLPYYFNQKTIKARLNLNSNYFNANDFLPKEEKKEGEKKKEKQESKAEKSKTQTSKEDAKAVDIPANIDFAFNTNLKKVIYDKINVTNIKGNVTVLKKLAKFDIGLNVFKGATKVKGSYSSKNIKKPLADFMFKLSKIDINEMYNSVTVVKEMLPIAEKTSGRVSMGLNFKTELQQDMQPNQKTMNGKGNLTSKTGLIVTGAESLVKIGDALKTDKFDKLDVKDFDIKFKIVNGDIIVDPFTVDLGGNKAKIWGKQGVDKTLDFDVNVDMKKTDLGKDITKLVNFIPGQRKKKTMPVDLKITNTIDNPKVKPNFSRALGQAKKEGQSEVKKEVKKKAEKEVKKLLNDKKTKEKAKKFLKGLF